MTRTRQGRGQSGDLMTRELKLALVQQPASEDKQDNLRRGLAALEDAAAQGAQVVAYAELAFEPFYPQRRATPGPGQAFPLDLAETIPGPITDAFCAKAKELGVVVVLNLYERAGELAYDSSPVIDADGSLLGVSRMVHICDYEGFHEQGYYAPGDTGAPVFATQHGRVGVAICYDRHHPEYLRGLAVQRPDVMIVPQAGAIGEWPEGLFEAELRVAAFQNGFYAALVNRVGPEPVLTFGGGSFVCDPRGNVLARANTSEAEILHSSLDLAALDDCAARRLFLPDRRPELYPDWLTTTA
jgi:beta-ureidopropionase